MLIERPPAGPDWAHEVKHDGYRLLARKEGERVTLWSRHGTKLTDRLPRIAEAVRGLAVQHALIDGEAVVLRPDGHSDFEAIRTKDGATRASYVAFDLLQLNGKDIRLQTIEDRRAELERIVKGADAILFSEAIAAEGGLVFAKACEMGLEGIVSKRVGSMYWSGRCRNWTKARNPAFQDRRFRTWRPHSAQRSSRFPFAVSRSRARFPRRNGEGVESVKPRACRQLSWMTAATRWIAPRKFRASLS